MGLFYFILSASLPQKTNKQTNKQTERTLTGTLQHLCPTTAGPDTNNTGFCQYPQVGELLGLICSS